MLFREGWEEQSLLGSDPKGPKDPIIRYLGVR